MANEKIPVDEQEGMKSDEKIKKMHQSSNYVQTKGGGLCDAPDNGSMW